MFHPTQRREYPMIFTSTTYESAIEREPLCDECGAPWATCPHEESSTVDAVRPEDPAPWLDRDGYRRPVRVKWIGSDPDTFAPRLEYRAPANPILLDFRKLHGEKSPAALVIAALHWTGALDGMVLAGVTWLPEHVEHARKVLTRLAALTPEPDIEPEPPHFADFDEEAADEARYLARYE